MAGIFEGLGTVGAGIAGLVGAGGEGGMKYLRKAKKSWEDLAPSEFDMTSLTAPELQVMGEVDPSYFGGVTPDSYERIAGSPEMRAAQETELRSLQDVSRTGMTDVDRIAARRAQLAMAQTAGQNEKAALARLAARGQLSGGGELAAAAAGGMSDANMAADMGSSLAEQAALRRLQASGQAASLAGQIRGADVSEQAQNADAANRFNELVYGILNNARMQSAQRAFDASKANVGNRQRVADENALNQYRTAESNINRQNQLRGLSFDQNLAKTKGLTGAYGDLGDAADAERTAKLKGIYDIGQGIGTAGDAAVDKLSGGKGIFSLLGIG